MEELVETLNELFDDLPNYLKKVKSIQKLIHELELAAQSQQVTRAQHLRNMENAANNTINTSPDIPGDHKNQQNTHGNHSRKIIDVELDSTGRYQVKPKRLDKK